MKTPIFAWFVWAIIFFVAQSGTMYLLLRVLKYDFFVSAIAASMLAAALAHLARRFTAHSPAV